MGSNGKSERHPQSRTEFVLLSNQQNIFNTQESISQEMMSKDDDTHFDTGVGELIEMKWLPGNTPLSYAYGSRTLVFPDRTLNAELVVGNPQVYEKARIIVLNEASRNDTLGARVRRHMKSQLRTHKRTIKTGMYRQTQVFSRKNRLQLYDEDSPLRFGFKMGFLRAVQRKLDIATATIMRSGLASPEELSHILPVNTADRLQFFEDLKVIKSTSAEGTFSAYSWFLQQYHCVQESYKNSERVGIVSSMFNGPEFDRNAQIIESFVNTQI